MIEDLAMKKKTRIIVQRGKDFLALRMESIACFYTQNKLVFAIDNKEQKYFCPIKLNELENELDSNLFFRVNRQFIVNLNFIKSFSIVDKVKLELSLTLQNNKFKIYISQVTAPHFKKWIYEEY